MKDSIPWIIALLFGGYLLLYNFFSSNPLTATPPTTAPTATPLPGYVAGEEIEAYASFVQYYDKEVYECYDDPSFTMGHEYAYSVDEKYIGKAIYAGGGIWRFYIRLGTSDITNAASC